MQAQQTQQVYQSTAITMADIPSELLAYIFEWIVEKRDKKNCKLTCSQFNSFFRPVLPSTVKITRVQVPVELVEHLILVGNFNALDLFIFSLLSKDIYHVIRTLATTFTRKGVVLAKSNFDEIAFRNVYHRKWYTEKFVHRINFPKCDLCNQYYSQFKDRISIGCMFQFKNGRVFGYSRCLKCSEFYGIKDGRKTLMHRNVMVAFIGTILTNGEKIVEIEPHFGAIICNCDKKNYIEGKCSYCKQKLPSEVYQLNDDEFEECECSTGEHYSIIGDTSRIRYRAFRTISGSFVCEKCTEELCHAVKLVTHLNGDCCDEYPIQYWS
jgi:hypothetical protein